MCEIKKTDEYAHAYESYTNSRRRNIDNKQKYNPQNVHELILYLIIVYYENHAPRVNFYI